MIKVNRNSDSELLVELLSRDKSSIGIKSFYETEDKNLIVKIGRTKTANIILDVVYNGVLENYIDEIRELLLSLNKDMNSFRKRLLISRTNDCINTDVLQHFYTEYNVNSFTIDAEDINISESIYNGEIDGLFNKICNKFKNINKRDLKSIFCVYKCKFSILNYGWSNLIVSNCNERICVYITDNDNIDINDIGRISDYLCGKYGYNIHFKTFGFSLPSEHISVSKCVHLFV